jgi:hypothetical protein
MALLWELLHNLALRGFYVLHTDHLNDGELYNGLWQHGLREPVHLPGRSLRGGWFHDSLGSWGEDDLRLWLRYYASDEERAKHAADWPKDANPVEVGSVNVGIVRGVALSGNYVYLANDTSGLQIYLMVTLAPPAANMFYRLVQE